MQRNMYSKSNDSDFYERWSCCSLYSPDKSGSCSLPSGLLIKAFATIWLAWQLKKIND
jgi:hypothetical protein